MQIGKLEPLQIENQRDRCQQQHGGHEHQIVVADVARDNGNDQRPGRRAGARACCDKSEQPLRLLLGKGVGHEAPEHRQVKQAEQADPDVEALVQQDAVRNE